MSVCLFTFKCRIEVDDEGSKRPLDIRVAFQVRVRPGCYGTGPQTIDARTSVKPIDSHIGNNEIEWFTQERPGVFMTALLIKIENFTDFEPSIVSGSEMQGMQPTVRISSLGQM